MKKFGNIMAKDIYMKFDSINDMFSYFEKFGEPSTDSASGGTYDPTWYASTSFQEAKQRCIKGDDNLAKMLRGSEKLDIHVPSTGIRKQMKTGVVGFMPHVPNFLAGVPNNMVFVEEKKIAKKIINVYFGCNTLASVTADEIAKVSARVMSCIMSLERKGYRCNLFAVNCAKRGGTFAGFSVKVKDSGQHIDILKLAFPFLSAAWNRRFGFRFREIEAKWNISMGSSVHGNELRDFLNRNNVKYDVALSYYDAAKLRTVEELEQLFIKSTKKIK